MERVQLLLEPALRKALKQFAGAGHTSMSAVVREMLRGRIQERRREKLRQASTSSPAPNAGWKPIPSTSAKSSSS